MDTSYWRCPRFAGRARQKCLSGTRRGVRGARDCAPRSCILLYVLVMLRRATAAELVTAVSS